MRKEIATFYSSTWVSWTLESPSIFLFLAKFKKTRKLRDFGGFQSPKLIKKGENCQLSTFGFQCLARNMEGWIKKTCISYLVFSRIWLNLPRDDSHFFYILLWMIATLATKKKSPKNSARDRPRAHMPKWAIITYLHIIVGIFRLQLGTYQCWAVIRNRHTGHERLSERFFRFVFVVLKKSKDRL